jgi:nucleoid-associated protein YgaU
MKKFLLIISVFFLGGCLVRTYTVEQQRVDMNVSGNQGYLSGSPKQTTEGKNRLGDKRKMSVLEVEFGPSYGKNKVYRVKKSKRKALTQDTAVASDVKDVNYEDESVMVADETPVSGIEEVAFAQEAEPINLASASIEDQYQWYTVKENDTLQKISKQFYQTTREWVKIYDRNKDFLKSPDKIYPGMKIRIPTATP